MSQQPPHYPNDEGWQSPHTQFQPPRSQQQPHYPNAEGWQQPPPYYNQPTEAWKPSPSSMSYPPKPPAQTPPGKTKRKLTRNEWLLGCILPLIILFLCIGSAAVIAATRPPTAQTVPTPTSTPTQAALLAASTDTPTLTDTPVPTDTPTPTPTAIPTATPTQKPVVIVTPTPKPQPTATHCVGVNNNPWCYDFNPGKYITYPPSGFCNYFNCIPTFYSSDDPGDGYIIECQDGTYSQSGGESGACSYHGGEMRPLYSH